MRKRVPPPVMSILDLPDVLDRLEAFAAKPGVPEQHRRDLKYAVKQLGDYLADEMYIPIEAERRTRSARDKRHPGSAEKNAKLAEMREQNKSRSEMADELKISKNALRKRLKRLPKL
jgi:hypothetical protein